MHSFISLIQTTIKYLMRALNSFVFAVGSSALGKKKKKDGALFSTVAGSGFLAESA